MWKSGKSGTEFQIWNSGTDEEEAIVSFTILRTSFRRFLI